MRYYHQPIKARINFISLPQQKLQNKMPDQYDPEWARKYEAERRSAQRKQTIMNGVYGYGFGQFIGTSAYVLQTRHVGPAAIGAGAFLGVCMGAGTIVRSL